MHRYASLFISIYRMSGDDEVYANNFRIENRGRERVSPHSIKQYTYGEKELKHNCY